MIRADVDRIDLKCLNRVNRLQYRLDFKPAGNAQQATPRTRLIPHWNCAIPCNDEELRKACVGVASSADPRFGLQHGLRPD
jgi:hypothetical protein